MKRHIIFVTTAMLVACGVPPAPPAASPVTVTLPASEAPPSQGVDAAAGRDEAAGANAQHPKTQRSETPQAIADAFLAAVKTCDRPTVQGLVVTFEEIASISKKATDRGEYDEGASRFVDTWLKDCAALRSLTLEARVVRDRVIPAQENAEKLHRDVHIAWISVSDPAGGKINDVRFTVIDTGQNGWKVSFKNS